MRWSSFSKNVLRRPALRPQSLGLVVGLALGLAAIQPALADGEATLLHVPPDSWVAGEAQSLAARIDRDWELEDVVVRMRPLDSRRDYREIPMRRVTADTFAAAIPASLVQPPGVEYYIACQERGTAEPRAHFASSEAPHPLLVRGETAETRLADRLARHRGHRSQLRLSGELTRYGRRYVDLSREGGSVAGPSDAGTDHFWTTRLDYTHRLLGVLYDIHFGVVLLRGRWATFTLPGGSSEPVDVLPGTADPGVNYGHGGIRIEIHRYFSVDADILLGASEDGFVAGFGSVLRVGRIAGTRFEAGVELLRDVGHMGFFRFAWDTVPRFPMALSVELIDRPAGDDNPLGTRLIYELGAELGDYVTITGSAGYATRTDAMEGGFVVGLVTAVEF